MCRGTFSEKSLFHFEPSQVSFALIVSSLLGCLQAGHAFIFPRNTTWPKNDVILRRKTCALLRATTSALLRRKTCAVLRARTCALLRANTKEAAFGRLHKGGRPSVAPLCGFLCIGSEQSTCPSSQHSTCLASQQSSCLLYTSPSPRDLSTSRMPSSA